MIIGITASSSKTQYFLNQAYINYVIEAGFQPLIILPDSDLELFANIIDGLLLPGGIDLDPIYYGEDNYNSFSVDPAKDDFERAMFHTVRDMGKPIFGICRGFQLIVREYMLHEAGGLDNLMYFYSHINEHAQTSDQTLSRTIPSHFVSYRPPLLYGYETGNKVEALPVNSMHHQCLVVNFKDAKAVTVQGFDMVAWTTRGFKKNIKYPQQKVCEAFSINGWNSPILAVQWHPEELRDLELIQNFFGGAQQTLEA